MRNTNMFFLIIAFIGFLTCPILGSDNKSPLEEAPLLSTPSLIGSEREGGAEEPAASNLPLLLREDDEEDFNKFMDQTQGNTPVEGALSRPTEAAGKELIAQQGLNFQSKGFMAFAAMPPSPSVGLSIDGGGMRGLIPAECLEKLETLLEENPNLGYNRKVDGLYKIFDYVGGTSSGGMLALGVAADLKPSRLITLFRDEGSNIFSRTGRGFISSLDTFGLFVPRYNPPNLESLLQKYFGDMSLQDAKTSILVTACTTQGHPCIFKKKDYDHKLWQVARSTSAAPTYFEAYYFPEARDFLEGNAKNDQPYFMDGGLWCNNPSPLIAASLVQEYQNGDFNPHNIHMLSLGTGEAPAHQIPWKGGQVQALLHGKAILDAFMTSHSYGNDNIMSQLFGNNYYRINPKLREPIGLDNTSPDAMKALEKALEDEENPECRQMLEQFVQNTENIINKKLHNWPDSSGFSL